MRKNKLKQIYNFNKSFLVSHLKAGRRKRTEELQQSDIDRGVGKGLLSYGSIMRKVEQRDVVRDELYTLREMHIESLTCIINEINDSE